ncbi:hypothetical protein ABT160_03425 [Streptomyces sp. NPDC001941]|uniref:hypothetical protein n=1 Tax=Streptomyces sp. NPDC001941 TaxID=3154659 RepID=UPI003330F0C8
MHSDVFLYVHEYRAADLRAEATAITAPGRPALRARLGWTLVELGLRLVREQRPAVPALV